MDLLIDWSNKTFFPLHSTYTYIQCKEAIHSYCTCAHDETLVINFHQMIFYFSFCLYFFFKHADCNHFLTEKTVHLFLCGGLEVLNADQSPHSPLQRICRPNVTVKSHKEVAKVKTMFIVLVPLVSYKDCLAVSVHLSVQLSFWTTCKLSESNSSIPLKVVYLQKYSLW